MTKPRIGDPDVVVLLAALGYGSDEGQIGIEFAPGQLVALVLDQVAKQRAGRMQARKADRVYRQSRPHDRPAKLRMTPAQVVQFHRTTNRSTRSTRTNTVA